MKNTKNCVHCGAELEESFAICNYCGCIADQQFVLTILRKKQFFLFDPPFDVEIKGSNTEKNIAVYSGEKINVSLTSGNYHIFVQSTIKIAELDIELTENKTVEMKWNRLTGELEIAEK